MDSQAQAQHQMYPCDGCGAQLQFQPGTTALQCPYCGHQKQIVFEQPGKVREHSWAKAAGKRRRPRNEVPANLFVCTQCAAHTESDSWSDECQFCGAPVVVDQFNPDIIAPEAVAPFAVDESTAKGNLGEWIKSRWFAPNALKKVQGSSNVKSTYLPHWTWDAKTVTKYRGQRGTRYKTTDSEGKEKTEIRWKRVNGTVKRNFDDVVVPASSHVLPDHMEKLEKDWDTKDVRPYHPQAIVGHHTQRYDVTPEQGFEGAKQRMDKIIKRDIRKDIGGDRQKIDSYNTEHNKVTFKLLLLPIWILTYMFSGKAWQVLVNGQTGKVVGERPFSWIKITLAVIAALIVIVGGYFLYNMFQQ
ncbi:hypothetical protein [Salininema proteolyticum]|uniref:Replication restart DNA helicase PriA n=1 Tax=Salininema proteolyticum TaxID=1607685 RepID=A0ABV8U178_9ACTN